MRSRQAGFAASDVVVAAALVAIMAAIAAPSVLRGVAAYQRGGAARQVMSEIRQAQSLAISRGGVFAFQWGNSVSRPDGEYRVVRDSGTCSLPATTAPKDNTNVIRYWTDIGATYPRTRISSMVGNNGATVGSVMFNSRGISVNNCASVVFPITVTVTDSVGKTRQIEIRPAGSVRLK